MIENKHPICQIESPHLLPAVVADSREIVKSINNALSRIMPEHQSLVRADVNSITVDCEKTPLKIPLSVDSRWSLVINQFNTLWPEFSLFLSPAIQEISNRYNYGDYFFELVLFAGFDIETPFGVHVDPSNMRAYHLQLVGSKTFVFYLNQEVRFGSEMPDLRASDAVNFKICSGQIAYLPTIYPHCAQYDGLSVGLALAVWKRSIGQKIDFYNRLRTEEACNSFEHYKSDFATPAPFPQQTVQDALRYFSDNSIQQKVDSWFKN